MPKAEETYLTRAEIGKTTNHHKEGNIFKAEVQISGNGINVYSVSEADDLYKAIDLVEAEMAHSLLSTKGRQIRMLRKGERMMKDVMRGIYSGFGRMKFKRREVDIEEE